MKKSFLMLVALLSTSTCFAMGSRRESAPPPPPPPPPPVDYGDIAPPPPVAPGESVADQLARRAPMMAILNESSAGFANGAPTQSIAAASDFNRIADLFNKAGGFTTLGQLPTPTDDLSRWSCMSALGQGIALDLPIHIHTAVDGVPSAGPLLPEIPAKPVDAIVLGAKVASLSTGQLARLYDAKGYVAPTATTLTTDDTTPSSTASQSLGEFYDVPGSSSEPDGGQLTVKVQNGVIFVHYVISELGAPRGQNYAESYEYCWKN